MSASALNKAHAEVGDIVEIETPDRRVLYHAFIVFIVPVLACSAFYAAGVVFLRSERYALICSVIGFLLSFAAVGVLERVNRKKKSDIVITRIVRRKNEVITNDEVGNK